MRNPPSVALVRVKTVESAQTVRTAFLNKSSELKVAGDYDVTIYNNQGKVVGYQREVLASGETKKIDGSKDLRPRLTVKHANASWGGIPVKLLAGQTTILRDFADFPLGELVVSITDRARRPVEHATLRIRDRMSDSWRQVEENPMQLRQADHPISYPASRRIEKGFA